MDRQRAMAGPPRLGAAVSAGLVPAIVAFIVLFVIDRDVVAALVTAAIVWIGLSIVMWVRFGKVRR